MRRRAPHRQPGSVGRIRRGECSSCKNQPKTRWHPSNDSSMRFKANDRLTKNLKGIYENTNDSQTRSRQNWLGASVADWHPHSNLAHFLRAARLHLIQPAAPAEAHSSALATTALQPANGCRAFSFPRIAGVTRLPPHRPTERVYGAAHSPGIRGRRWWVCSHGARVWRSPLA